MTVTSPYMVMGSTYAVGPPGLKPSKASTVSIQYNPRNVPTGYTESELHLYRVLNHEWSLVAGSTDDSVTHVVTGPLSATGTYGVFATSASAIPPENQITYGLGWDQKNLIKVSPDGSNYRQVQNVPPIDIFYGGAEYYNSSENGIYFYTSSPSGGDILATSIDGSNPTKITALALQNGNGFSSSADGSTVLLSLYEGSVWHVIRMNADGTGQQILASGGSTGGPVFNLQNTQIAYADNDVIHIISSTGSPIRSITLAGSKIMDLAFNPAGTTLACSMLGTSLANPAIYTVPVAGGAATKRSAGLGDVEPTWSPDGTKIAFLSAVNTGSQGIYYITATSTDSSGTQVQYTTTQRITLMWR